jgi:YfiH family protein
MSNDAFFNSLIKPNWQAPTNVKSLQTTRFGGVSKGKYASLNLGIHVNDNPLSVSQNRELLNKLLPSEPVWLKQVHGVEVVDAASITDEPVGDASFTRHRNIVCVTMTADCLPVLLCDLEGTAVAAVHAGWRSLCEGVIEATVNSMQKDSKRLMAWLGPAIGPQAFELGDEVRQQFIAKNAVAESAFVRKGDRWLGDLYQIARQRLNALGVNQIYGGNYCTFSDPARFFSYRRDGETGRMGTFIWLD